MAKLYRTDRIEDVEPANGKAFTLKELQTIVGGYIEIVYTHQGDTLIIDEEGKLKDKPYNAYATGLYRYGAHDAIVGDALLITDRSQIDSDDDDESEAV